MSSIHDQRSCADHSRQAKRNIRPATTTSTWPPISATDLPIKIILQRLEGVRESSAGQYSALCPHHGDSRPSLSVHETDDHKVLIYCHAGCVAEKILGTIGLKLRDLFPSDFAIWHADRYGRGPIVIDSVPHYHPRPATTAENTALVDMTPTAEAAHKAAVNGTALGSLAVMLGVPEFPLHWLGIGLIVHQSVCCWTFPERDSRGAVVGILLRRGVTGDKTSLPGGRRGLYVPSAQPAAPPALPFFITEGATDLVALLGQGCPGIGRPAARPSMQAIG
jgi:hypothetical protein